MTASIRTNPETGQALTRRGFLALLGVAGVAALLLGGGCVNAAAEGSGPSRTPPPRAWDDSEILRAGRWAG